MAILINSDGTLSSSFGVGDGVVLVNDSGAATITSDGSALATLKGADPVANSDFVTLDYFNSNAPSASDTSTTLKLNLAFNSTSPVDSTATYALGAIAFRVIVDVETAFNGTAGDANFSVGWADGTGTRTEMVSASTVDLYSADTYIIDIIIENATGGVSSIGIAYTADTNADATAGAAAVYVEVVATPKT
tara:strand:- start:566 stop:1138 length:573 start_codon:yes stop_codon:yes gene_type:complete